MFQILEIWKSIHLYWLSTSAGLFDMTQCIGPIMGIWSHIVQLLA